MRIATGLVTLLLLALAPPAIGHPAAQSDEARTAAMLDRLVDSPPRLRMFLQAMPKGADLHNHGGGSIYAEDFLAWAAADGLCIATDKPRIVDPPCDAPNRVPAAGLEHDYSRYSAMIDALSTRGFEAGVGDPMVSGYDRFFATFEHFSPASADNGGRMLAATREQAAADHVGYVELGMGSRDGMVLAVQMGSVNFADREASAFADLLARMAPALPGAIAATRATYDRYETQAATIGQCASAAPQPGCTVRMRYLYTAIRTQPPAQVFAQLAFGFALAEADPRFVGINIAAPEHDPVAVRDYALHMRMIGWLAQHHPKVGLSLHAGELTLGLVPPRDLRFHINDAVAVAGARRIGHGVDIAYEANAPALLRRMAHDRIAVEINLTSNAVILGVKGPAHPLALYREAGVPVALSTDDEGVSRSDMTNEYLRAVTEQHLRYRDLKQIARDGLQYSFLPGGSLWLDRPGGPKHASCTLVEALSCHAYLSKSPKAAAQVQLEKDFRTFEATVR
jgi:adenosine deaminase